MECPRQGTSGPQLVGSTGEVGRCMFQEFETFLLRSGFTSGAVGMQDPESVQEPYRYSVTLRVPGFQKVWGSDSQTFLNGHRSLEPFICAAVARTPRSWPFMMGIRTFMGLCPSISVMTSLEGCSFSKTTAWPRQFGSCTYPDGRSWTKRQITGVSRAASDERKPGWRLRNFIEITIVGKHTKQAGV